MRICDVVVAGSGLAGMMTAILLARKGRKVTLLTRGSPCLAISGGCVDVLGYMDGKRVHGDPLEALQTLPASHTYRTLGKDAVVRSLALLSELCEGEGVSLAADPGLNMWMPTVLGTFKPTYLAFPRMDKDVMEAANSVIIPRLPLKDCPAELALRGFSEVAGVKGKVFLGSQLDHPFGHGHRDLTQLDLARHLETQKGQDWLVKGLAPCLRRGAVLLLPPILGIDRHAQVRKLLEGELSSPIAEMLSPPPGVGGLRILGALRRAASKAGVRIVENAEAVAADVEGGACAALHCGTSVRTSFAAREYVIATGGFLGGGIRAYPGMAREALFDLPLKVPSRIEDWSTRDVFKPQPYAAVGVAIDGSMRPVDRDGKVVLSNVRFAGRILAGHDPAAEMCGNGVALASALRCAEEVGADV
jgi:glycerol-3-phosphate dehydrogenase subunit B